jgi:nuclear pore complex protein Nup98-Nup96
MALISLNYTYISKECLENLHESYAAQLQSIGLWQWAVFILMHIEDDQRYLKQLTLMFIFLYIIL